MKKQTNGTLFLCRASVIAAVYAVLTLFTFGFASGAVQFRLSEALCILAVFTPAAVPGLFVGCVAANLLSGCAVWDIVFGSLATLAGAFGVHLLRRHPFLAPLPYVLANTLVIPPLQAFVYGAEGTLPFFYASIGISELLSAWGLGIGLYLLLRPCAGRLFGEK